MRVFPTLLLLSMLPNAVVLADPTTPKVLSADVNVTVSPIPLDQSVSVNGKSQLVTLAFRDVPIQDAIRALAQKANFNVVVDSSIKGKLNLDLKDVTIQDALEAIRSVGKLSYTSDHNTLFVADEASSKGRSFRKKQLAVIPLKNTSPAVIADLLNDALFATPSSANTESSSALPALSNASADPRTNSVIIVGTPNDIATARREIAALDIPRHSKTWRLNNSNALNVSTMLSASLFNDGIPAIMVGGSSSAISGASNMNRPGNQPATVRVQAENIQEGQGVSQTSGGNGGSGGSGGGSSGGSMPANITIRDRTKENSTAQINPRGVMIIPDTRQNSITLMGTTEQIAMADHLIEIFDKKASQVVIEASLIEINNQGLKELGGNVAFNLHKFAFGFNNTQGAQPTTNSPFNNNAGIPTSASTPLESLFRFNNTPVVKTFQIAYQINALIQDQKAKLISHPSILTTHDSESVISIVDEIVRSVTVTLNTGAGGQGRAVSTQANIGEAGIILSILPKIGANNTVSLRVRPTVSTVRQTTKDITGNLITLLSKRELVAQNVTLEDGQSFVLGGFINNNDTKVSGKIPALGDLPIVGALARSSTDNKSRSELLVIITPHILPADDDSSNASASSVPAAFKSTAALLPPVKHELLRQVPEANVVLKNEKTSSAVVKISAPEQQRLLDRIEAKLP